MPYDEMNQFEELTRDEITGKAKPTLNLLNKKDLNEDDLDSLFLSETMLYP